MYQFGINIANFKYIELTHSLAIISLKISLFGWLIIGLVCF